MQPAEAQPQPILGEIPATRSGVTEEAHNRPRGIYSGYFRDLDGHP